MGRKVRLLVSAAAVCGLAVWILAGHPRSDEDAPVEADSVFVTFCGIYVESIF